MQAVSARFLRTLRASHEVVVRVDAQLDGAVFATELPVVGGSVTVDRSSNVRRQATVQLATELLSPEVAAQLNVYGTELLVWRGIRYVDGTDELVLLGTFRVDSIRRGISGPSTLTCSDRAAQVIDVPLQDPVSKPSGRAVLEFMQYLVDASLIDSRTITPFNGGVNVTVRNLVPETPPVPQGEPVPPRIILHTYDGNATMGAGTLGNSTTSPSAPAPPVTYSDRWDALVQLGRGAEVYFAPDGNLEVRPVIAIDSPAVWVIDSGRDGVLLTYSRNLTREEMSNAIHVRCERADGTVVHGYAADTDPASPTYVYGPFGRVLTTETTTLTTSTDYARQLAQTFLDARKGLRRTVSLECIPNPALDVGDVVLLVLPDGTVERHILDRLTIPLDNGSAMGVDTRTSALDPYLPRNNGGTINPTPTPTDPEPPLVPTPDVPPEPNPPVLPPLPPAQSSSLVAAVTTEPEWHSTGEQYLDLYVELGGVTGPRTLLVEWWGYYPGDADENDNRPASVLWHRHAATIVVEPDTTLSPAVRVAAGQRLARVRLTAADDNPQRRLVQLDEPPLDPPDEPEGGTDVTGYALDVGELVPGYPPATQTELWATYYVPVAASLNPEPSEVGHMLTTMQRPRSDTRALVVVPVWATLDTSGPSGPVPREGGPLYSAQVPPTELGNELPAGLAATYLQLAPPRRAQQPSDPSGAVYRTRLDRIEVRTSYAPGAQVVAVWRQGQLGPRPFPIGG